MISWESVLGGHAGKACVFCTASKSLVSCLYDILIWYMHTLFGLLESSYVSLLESFLYSLTWLVELLISALSSLSTSMAGYENSLMKMSGYVGDYQWTCGDVAEVKRRMRIVHSWIAQS